MHIRDMKTLPDCFKEELKKDWVFQKGYKRFSAMPLDQAHEQNNAKVKESGGAVGLTESPSALKRWMVAGPEQARLLSEFEDQYNKTEETADYKNHEEGLSTQIQFKEHVNNLSSKIVSTGNPFMEKSNGLMTLDGDCVQQNIIEMFREVETQGQSQYTSYVKDVFVERSKSIHDPIKQNKTLIFKPAPLPIENSPNVCNS